MTSMMTDAPAVLWSDWSYSNTCNGDLGWFDKLLSCITWWMEQQKRCFDKIRHRISQMGGVTLRLVIPWWLILFEVTWFAVIDATRPKWRLVNVNRNRINPSEGEELFIDASDDAQTLCHHCGWKRWKPLHEQIERMPWMGISVYGTGILFDHGDDYGHLSQPATITMTIHLKDDLNDNSSTWRQCSHW